MILSLLFVN